MWRDIFEELHELNTIFTDPSIVKVLHGADRDVLWLQRDFSVYLVNMFDTGQAARQLKLRHPRCRVPPSGQGPRTQEMRFLL